MLKVEGLTIRVVGINELYRLALEDPKRCHRQITNLLDFFVRNPTTVNSLNFGVREDVEVAKVMLKLLKRQQQ